MSRFKRFSTDVLLMFAVAICQNSAFAQTVRPIQFVEGKTSAVVKDSKTQSFTIRVGAGQTCKIRLISMRNAAMLEVLDADESDLTEGSNGRSFENATDLKINVTSKIAYALNVSIK